MEIGCTRTIILLVVISELLEAHPFIECSVVPRSSNNSEAILHKEHFSISVDYTVSRFRKKVCSKKGIVLCLPNPKYLVAENMTDSVSCEDVKEDSKSIDFDLLCHPVFRCDYIPHEYPDVEGKHEAKYCCCSQDMCYYSNLDSEKLRELSIVPHWRQLYRRVCTFMIIFTFLAFFMVLLTVVFEVVRAGCKWPEPAKDPNAGCYIDENGNEVEGEPDKNEELVQPTTNSKTAVGGKEGSDRTQDEENDQKSAKKTPSKQKASSIKLVSKNPSADGIGKREVSTKKNLKVDNTAESQKSLSDHKKK